MNIYFTMIRVNRLFNEYDSLKIFFLDKLLYYFFLNFDNREI